MSGETTPHVAPMLLWGYTCGTIDLVDEDFDHLSTCADCQMLVCQLMDVLEEIAIRHNRGVA